MIVKSLYRAKTGNRPPSGQYRPVPSPVVEAEFAGSSQQPAAGRIKPQRACRRHPREAISPGSCLRRPLGPRPHGGLGPDAGSSAAHLPPRAPAARDPACIRLPPGLSPRSRLSSAAAAAALLSGSLPSCPAPPRAARREAESWGERRQGRFRH